VFGLDSAQFPPPGESPGDEPPDTGRSRDHCLIWRLRFSSDADIVRLTNARIIIIIIIIIFPLMNFHAR